MIANERPMNQAKKNSRLIVELLYPSRLLFYLWLLLFGFAHTARQVGRPPLPDNQAELFSLLCAVGAITLLFVYAKIINDIYDLTIDRISNKRRPMVEGIISVDAARRLSTVLLAVSGIFALLVCNRSFICQWLVIGGLSYLYSTPPARLRRFWPIGHMTLVLIGGSVFVAGTCIARPDGLLNVGENKTILACLLLAFFFLSQIKDLKDIEGDRQGGVDNIFGCVSHPRGLALIFYSGFLLMAFFVATNIGVGVVASVAGTLVCAAIAVGISVRSKQLAGLDRLFSLAFIFLLYLAVVWIR